MRLAALLSTATGSTTLLMKMRLVTRINTMQTAATPATTRTESRICRSAFCRAVTIRRTPTTLPSVTMGQETERMFSWVWGSLPRKACIRSSRTASLMSPVPGERPVVRLEAETRILPPVVRNWSSMLSFSSKVSA